MVLVHRSSYQKAQHAWQATEAVILFKKIAEQALSFMSTREITQNKGKLDVWSFVHFIHQKAVLSACEQSLDSLGILLLSKLIIIGCTMIGNESEDCHCGYSFV